MNPHRNSFIKRLLLLIALISTSLSLVYVIGKTQSESRSEERKFTVKEFKDMPLAVKVKNLQSKAWHRDLQIEVKNISEKPIYFILAYLIFPDDKVGDGEVGIALSFGRRENVRILHLAQPDDPHLEPKATYVFMIPEPERSAFEGRHKHNPNLDKNLLLRFSLISFGDGTGYEVGEPRDFRKSQIPLNDPHESRDVKKKLLVAEGSPERSVPTASS